MGVCALCRREKVLQDSHYIPRSFHRRSHSNKNGKPQEPVWLDSSKALYQAAQIKTYLLCSDCEQRFSELGESWSASCSLQLDGSFPLRDLLQQRAPAYVGSESLWYLGAMYPELRVKELNYFAASVFWRGAVNSWTKKNTGPELSLPGQVVEDLRLFLLADSELPDRLSMILEVHRHPEAMFNFPRGSSHAERGTWLTFTVYGLTFYLVFPSSYPTGEPHALSFSRFPFPTYARSNCWRCNPRHEFREGA